MVKNDYRRSLIMLRPHAQGYSGHVRLERRTLMGSMYFVIGVPSSEGTLCATLVRRYAQGTYFAVRLGELRRDGRGQATLAHAFDPRNIDGRTLEDYLLITVVHSGPEGCDVVLSGNVNGSQEVNWNSVRAASCAVCAPPREPACDLCPPPPEPRQENEEEGPVGLLPAVFMFRSIHLHPPPFLKVSSSGPPSGLQPWGPSPSACPDPWKVPSDEERRGTARLCSSPVRSSAALPS